MKNLSFKRLCKKISAVGVCGAVMLSTGCYLLPDEEEVLTPPSVKASEVSYTTVTAKKKDLEKKIVLSGTVTAENQYDLSYEKLSGTVAKFYVKSGDEVKKGDVICALDTYDLDYQIEEKELYLEKAKLNMQIITESGGTQAEIDSASVDVQLLENELEKLNEQKENSSLRSPIDGVVSSLADVRAGDSVNPGEVIATVIDTSALYLAVQPTSTEDFNRFDIGTEVQIHVNDEYYDGTVFMNPDALTDYLDEQKENHNDDSADPIDYESGTVYIRFEGEIPTEAVGQIADAILVLDSVSDAIVISNNLIKTVDGEKVVYVLKDGVKTSVPVETGLETGSQTEIKSGLSEGDEIVLR
jgi:RND family efflux transporter MFP subunit